MFCLISGAHSGPISRIWSGTHPGFEIVFFFSPRLWPAIPGQGRLRLAMARHGRSWPAIRRKKEYYFKSWMGPGPNSENRPRMGSGSEAKHRKSLPNRRQQGAPSAPPKGAALRAAPLGSCCLLFGKDFLCFASFPEPILGRFPEFGPGPIQDLKIVFFFPPSSRCY